MRPRSDVCGAIRPILLRYTSHKHRYIIYDFKTDSTIATSIVQSTLDYCNSLFLNLTSTQIQGLQLIQKSLARAVTRTPRHHHITSVLKTLHWLKIPERIHFKVFWGHPFMTSTKNQAFDPLPCPHEPDPLPLVDVCMRLIRNAHHSLETDITMTLWT